MVLSACYFAGVLAGGALSGGAAPGVADASQVSAMAGPDTVDGIAPAGAWPTW